jgi:hypothetical protein
MGNFGGVSVILRWHQDMRSNGRDMVSETFDELVAAARRCAELSFDALSTPDRLTMSGRSETVCHRPTPHQHPPPPRRYLTDE